jgi:transposase-like protein
MEWETDVHTYLQVFSEGCPEELRPTYCSHCRMDRLFHRHGKYQRKVFTWLECFLIFIYRFKCTACGHTQSLLPSFTGPHQQVIWDVQEEVVRKNEEGASLGDLTEELKPPAGPYSQKTLWRWKKTWERRLEAVEVYAWKWFLNRLPHLQMPVGEAKPKSRWGWLFHVFEQAGTYLSPLQSFRLFHWLYRLHRSLLAGSDGI